MLARPSGRCAARSLPVAGIKALLPAAYRPRRATCRWVAGLCGVRAFAVAVRGKAAAGREQWDLLRYAVMQGSSWIVRRR